MNPEFNPGCAVRKAIALSRSSCTSTPRNATFAGATAAATAASSAASFRQGPHQDAQKFSTTTAPRWSARS